ncbi:PLP-dependent aminotransferase family protein [Paludifilum halophilum]|uniref:GntR family transcriptional regulator n=1 Tax=Paludifilum halophilum TaxID=1642702 RepID=A0A235B2R1_9BACL|nr:PLP-dependent aminotransferase family protein [Paludifilum halophilum]OYD06187.1 GntR family transcriptional regulator [Paludifilum halophilum]
MNIELNRGSRIPLARQIKQAIADRILSGYFKKGARLPSVRKLAQSLRVSPVTVIHALDLLETKGLVKRIHGKGTFVYEDENESETEQTEEPTPFPVSDYLHRSQHWYFHQRESEINFSLCAVHPELLPASDLAQSIRQLAMKDPEVLVQYGEIQGDLELRRTMAKNLAREHLALSPQEVLVTNGAQQGIDLVARSFIGPGDLVVTEEPTYTAAIDAFRSRGANLLTVPMDEEGIRIDKLTALLDTYKPKLIYTIPSFQNPTGNVMSAKRRRELFDLARHTNCLILEDDPWSEIFFDKAPPPPIKSLDQSGHVIYLKGISKMLSPGCRVGFLTASGTVLHRLVAAKTHADLGNPLLNQKVILPLLQPENLSSLLKQLRTVLKKRRDTALRLLRHYAPPQIQWTIPQGGLNLWISLPERIRANSLLQEAEKRRISFLPGSSCYPGDPEWNHLRISFSYVDEGQLKEGIQKLCSILSAYLASAESRKGETPLF